MIIFMIDDNAYKLLVQWAYDYSDLVIRFCDDITPKFESAKMILSNNGQKPIDVMYKVDQNKIAYMYVPSTDKEQIRFTISSNLKNEKHYAIGSNFEKVATFYVDIADIFATLNAFLLNGEYSAAAKKAMEKKTLLEFRKNTYFTIKSKDKRAVLDTCAVEHNGDGYVIK